ncbi:urease accessory protein UreE [Paenibacillus thiaminolyticus]|uniref:Urease accessory protein UreE n=1 Tax=Paenibacillus thiaminolyticus TaxID=49283 RepID=A0AAP9DZ14_PANTH|nr:urease accessory protein UreE [Paenibacillus thiaminolyticus]MCY9537135.1 urease accessory protein UreE [Paenibacillus thiaminolyticus]MCY9603106.1 urease accessory protein UreE [Paenibacillus thiaminolyticus]MCY9607936.1 urease accessory protein UreE [Paenibacillus thiaminolyticus]MCY9613553.1 urease accessory protein UreE [Paenibacillus thiaminolyticus]MCY9618715.1 urease accessory protein UreE [Paenibacillus thiaminolyticus]
MIIEQIAGSLADLSPEERAGRHMEKVFMASEDMLKTIQRVTTDHGNEIGIRLAQRTELKDGDILYMDDNNMIVIEVMPDDVLIIQPRSIREMGEIAHKLGNRHLPAQFEGDAMVVQYDYLVEEQLMQDGIPFARQNKKMKQAFRHVGHKH